MQILYVFIIFYTHCRIRKQTPKDILYEKIKAGFFKGNSRSLPEAKHMCAENQANAEDQFMKYSLVMKN